MPYKPTLQPRIATFALLVLTLILTLAETGTAQTKKEIQYLSGRDNEHTVKWDFYCTSGRNSGQWTTIAVPSQWEQQGFGRYDYGRDYRTFGKDFRFADETGKYKHTFEVPGDWKNKVVYIVFEGSMTDTEVMVNGTPAGEKHQGAFYRFKYDITDKLKPGKQNLLEVTVNKMSADESVNHAERYADYWVFGGIYRPVYLEAYPKEHIEHIAIAAKADGSFALDVYAKNLTEDRIVNASILDATGKPIAAVTGTITEKEGKTTLKTTVKNPNLWTAETPHLYKAIVSLNAGKKKLSETEDKFGFRTIEIKHGDGIYVNGTKIKMKGINRHCFWPETGRSLNPAIDLADVKLIKGMNMNAVRCSHYPPDQSFLNICDSLGLYVLDELGGWQNAYNTTVGEKLVREMVLRDVNHPSIIFWSNGNEGGTNKELDDDFDLYDPSHRPVIHAHHKPGNAFNGIDTNHYESYYSSEKILQDSLIYMPTEFLHAQDDGGAAVALHDYWEMMWAAKRSGGGFLWALLDEGIVRTDLDNIIDVNRINAPDGVVGPHREKEGSYNAIREIWSPVVITMKELPASFNGEINVENRYHFTDLSKCKFTWQLVNFYKPGAWQRGHQVMKEGMITGPAAPPLAKAGLKLPLPADWKNYDALLLTAYDPFENVVMNWSWKVKNNEALLQDIVTRQGNAVTVSADTDSVLTLKANGISISFDKRTGEIAKLQNEKGLELLFGNGPVMCGGSARFKTLKHFTEGDVHIVEAAYEGDLNYARWKMYGSGWLELEYQYTLNGRYRYAGISFEYPESNILGAKWLGNGPYRVWKNRQQGVTLDVHENLYNDTHTGSYPWQYPEFKGYFSNITWVEISTSEGKFLIASKEKDVFVRLFDFTGISGPDKYYPSLPPGNLSFLDGIPPMGTKLATGIDSQADQLGPDSKWNEFNGAVKHTLYFFFGYPK